MRSVEEVSIELAEAWEALAGPNGHFYGCRCGGVGEGGESGKRIRRNDFSNLFTCRRLHNLTLELLAIVKPTEDNRLMAEAAACETCWGKGFVVSNPDWPRGDKPYREACPEGDHGLARGQWPL